MTGGSGPALANSRVSMVRTRPLGPASLLALDPDLGALLAGDRAAAARESLLVPVQRRTVGEWDVSRLTSTPPRHLGLLVVDGVLARQVLLECQRSTELIGPGDLIRPWRLDPDVRLLRHEVQWQVLADATMAVLDSHLAAALSRFPEVAVVLLDRADQRAARLAVEKAIGHLKHVEARLLALFWLLAERWGRRTSEGIAVPLTLSHRVLGELIGARRPTISTSLTRLARERTLIRRPDGSWLLTGEPVGLPSRDIGRFTPLRRRLLSDSDEASGRDVTSGSAG